ncbi:MAG: ATP-dependent zinc protease [Cocleimonas sp.]|nr:ATP-dependent zinc protease [Cocleimonas sp.]
MSKKIHLGWREWVALPDLGLPAIKAKIDTGAKTSALHAFKVKKEKYKGVDRIQFSLHPLQHNRCLVRHCEAPLLDERAICNSSGQWETRYVIQSQIVIGTLQFPIEITLTDRDNMRFRMLLGRQALQQPKNVLIDPFHSYLANTTRINRKQLKQLYPPTPPLHR